MESSGKIKLKITWVIVIIDKSRAPDDSRYSKILLDNELPPSLMVDELNEGSDFLKELNDKYLKYDHRFILKNLVSTRIISSNLLEVLYVSIINYIPGLNKAGTIYTNEELQQRNIQLDDYYERAISRFGAGTY